MKVTLDGSMPGSSPRTKEPLLTTLVILPVPMISESLFRTSIVSFCRKSLSAAVETLKESDEILINEIGACLTAVL